MSQNNGPSGNKSFVGAFFVIVGLLGAANWWFEPLGLNTSHRAIALVAAGLIPIAIQLVTGYGLDPAWVARYSRTADARNYWASFIASTAIAAAFAFGAYRILSGANHGAP